MGAKSDNSKFFVSFSDKLKLFLGKSSVSELHFYLNIMTVIDNIILKKGIKYLLSDGKSTAKSVYYLHSWSGNDR